MPRRPASPGLIVTLAAAGALVAGAAGTGAYLGVTEYLADRPGTGDPTDPNSTETGGPGESPSTPSATPCPEEIAAAVRDEGGRGELTQVIYVKGALDGRPSAEAWICRDSDGTVYYQGHELAGPFVGGRSNYTILLGGDIEGSVAVEGNVYRAYPRGNSGYHYEVSPGTFAKVEANGQRRDYDVVEVITDLR